MLPLINRRTSQAVNPHQARRLGLGYTLLETLVALALLIVLTVLALAIYRHHFSPQSDVGKFQEPQGSGKTGETIVHPAEPVLAPRAPSE